MKQKHTKKRSANRGRKGTFSLMNYTYSDRRVLKRESLQPQFKKRHFGQQVMRKQAITKEQYIGVRRTVVKTIEHVDVPFERKKKELAPPYKRHKS